MMLRLFLMMAGMLIMTDAVMAQKSVTGTVSEKGSGEILSGVTVTIKGTGVATTTNNNGQFKLELPAGESVLVFTHVSMNPVETRVGNQSVINMIMMPRLVLADSIVVIGYGAQHASRITNAISKVGSAELTPEKNIVSDIGKALQGRVPGLFVAATDANPNSSLQIQIRGVQTAAAALSNPLIVIDGLIVEGNTYSLNNINPQDIESIEVLKDAASAAIYGARGSTGVIIITTKKGRANSKPAINVNSYYGFNNVVSNRAVLGTDDYKAVFTEARRNRMADIDAQLAAGGLTAAQIAQLNSEKNNLNNAINNLSLADRSTNWVDKVKNKNAPVSNLQVSMNGGSDKTQYYMSVGRYGEENSIGTGKFARYTGRLDLTQRINNWLKVEGNISFNRNSMKGYTFPLVSALQVRPDSPEEPVRNSDGTLGYYAGFQQHPLGIMLDNDNINRQNNLTGNLALDIALSKKLSFRSLIAGNKADGNSYSYSSPYTYNGSFNKGTAAVRSSEGFNYNLDNYFTYTDKWMDRLGATLTAGQSFYSIEQHGYGYDLNGFPAAAGIDGAGAASAYGSVFSIPNINSFYKEYSESYFLRSNFDLDGKYLLNAAIRTDGSSKLVEGNRYSLFPSLSAGWVMSKEQFFDNIKIVDFLKLRASYGQTGNIRPLGMFDAQNLLTAGSYLGAPSLLISAVLGNDAVQWEKTTQYDAGIDMTLLQNRLSISFDVYKKKTDGLLTSNFTPWSSGFNSKKDNIGAIQNTGLDASLTYSSNKSRDFHWEFTANIGVNRNKVLSLRDSVMSYGTFIFYGPQSQVKVGQPVGSVLVLQSNGVNPQTGDMMYADINKDGAINSKDYVNVPIALPKFYGGFNINLGYKGLELNALFSFVYGNKIYDYYEQTMRDYNTDWFGIMPNKFDILSNRWQKPGDITDVPRAIVGVHGAGKTTDWNFQPSTQFIYDASYLRLRNLVAAYTVPYQLSSKLHLTKARVYLSAQNVFTLTKYIGFDPETASNSGIVSSNTPQPRAIVLGIDLSL